MLISYLFGMIAFLVLCLVYKSKEFKEIFTKCDKLSGIIGLIMVISIWPLILVYCAMKYSNQK